MSESGISRGHKFINDLALYAIGNIGSKLITFMLVPFYTFFITDPAEFGYYDICLTVAFCLNPFISLMLPDGAMRFLLEPGDSVKRRTIISYTARVMAVNSGLLLVLGLVLSLFVDIKYLGYILVFGISQSLYDGMLQILRGVGKTKVYVSAGIFNALSIAMTSVLTVAVLRLGIPGVFISNIISRLMAIAFVEYRTHLLRDSMGRNTGRKELKSSLMRYSTALIPMVFLWWVLNANGVFFIKHFLGLEENGIYAILSKFTGILFVFSLIFYQTWQQNAIEQYESPDRDRFFTTVFNNYFYLMSFLVALFPFLIRMNLGWLVSEGYDAAGKYFYANSVYMMCFAICSFFELGYQCSKQTRRILPGVFLAMALNIAGNYLFVPQFGINGLIGVNIVTYLFLTVYRSIDTRKYMRIGFSLRNFLNIAGLILAGILFYSSSTVLSDLLSLIVLTAVFFIFRPPHFFRQLRR